jgi:hypothetical protein
LVTLLSPGGIHDASYFLSCPVKVPFPSSSASASLWSFLHVLLEFFLAIMFLRPCLLFVLVPFANAALTYKGVDVRKFQAQDLRFSF